MSNLEEFSSVALILGVIAVFNWVAGDRSFMRRELLLRRGSLWEVARWIGIVLWMIPILIAPRENDVLAYSTITGAILLLFGTARIKSKN